MSPPIVARRLVLCFLPLLACPVLADGIPVDRKTHKVAAPHLLISLSKAQQHEITALGTLTLEEAQWEKVREKCPLYPMRTSTILPFDYRDCTCEMGNYAIQMDANTVAILTDRCFTIETFLYASEKEDPELEEEARSQDGKEHEIHVSLRMDTRGQFYANGALIPFKQMLETLSGKMPDGTKKGSIFVHLPTGMNKDSPTLAERLNQLHTTADKSGWKFLNQMADDNDGVN